MEDVIVGCLVGIVMSILMFSVYVYKESQIKRYKKLVSNARNRLHSLVHENHNKISAIKELFELKNIVSNNLPIHFFHKDTEPIANYVYANQLIRDFFNCQADLDARIKATDLFNPDQIKMLREEDLIVMNSNGAACKFTHDFISPKGKRTIFQVYKALHTDKDGKQLIVGAAFDITEQTLLKEQEQNLTKFFKDMLENIPIGIIAKDADKDFTFVMANSYFAHMAGVNVNDIIGKTDFEINFRSFNPHHCIAQDKQVMNSGKRLEELETISDSDGNVRYFSVSKLPLRLGTQNLLVGTFAEVTELKNAHISEQRYKLMLEGILDNVPMAVCAKDPLDDYKYLFCNAFFRKVLNIKNEDIIGKDYKALAAKVGVNTVEQFSKKDKRTIETGIPTSSMEKAIFDNLGLIYFNSYRIPLQLSKDKKLLISAFVDVTKLNLLVENSKSLNQILVQLLNEENIDVALNRLLDSACNYLDADRSFVLHYDLANKNINHQYEYHKPELKPFGVKLTVSKLDISTEWFRKLASGQPIFISENRQKNNDRVARSYLEWSKQAANSEIKSLFTCAVHFKDCLWGNFGIVFDQREHVFTETEQLFLQTCAKLISVVIERYQNLQNLVTALNEARMANDAKTFFISSISHEVRTPLNAVLGSADIIRYGNLSKDEIKENVNSICHSSKALLNIVNDMLTLAKLSSGNITVIPELTNVHHMCTRMMAVFDNRCKEKSLELSCHVEPMPSLFLDGVRVRQILFNLLGNAIKFTEKGSINLSASFKKNEGEELTGTLQINVADTGCGIKKEDTATIYDPYSELPSTRNKNSSCAGTGLGLAVCKRLVEFMNGKIEVESEIDKGSTFSIILYNIEYSNKINDLPESSQSDGNEEKTYNILLVDDVKSNLNLEKSMLRGYNVNTFCAQSAEEAIEILNVNHIDLILTDLYMPKINGDEFAKIISRIPTFDSIPIIAVTADIDDRNKFKMSHFKGILTKPMTLNSLTTALSLYSPEIKLRKIKKDILDTEQGNYDQLIDDIREI